MGLFGRKQRPEPTQERQQDDALEFWTRDEADAFRAAVADDFARRGLEVTMHLDHAEDGAGRQFGLWNMAALCADADRDAWGAIIEQHLSLVIASMEAPDPFETMDADEVRRSTYARLHHLDNLPSPDAVPFREIAPGLVEVLALDLPESIATFGHTNADRFGGFDALREVGRANLAALEVERHEVVETDEGARFDVVVGDSFYTGSRALLLPSLAEQHGGAAPSEHGWLMTVPNRHQVAWHVLSDASVIPTINALVRFGVGGFNDFPGPVSPHLYWWNGEHYEQLTQLGEDGSVGVHVSPRLQASLEAVVGQPLG